jgi:hypothetical protein
MTKHFLILLFCVLTYSLGNANDTTYVKKYCIAYNTFLSNKLVDHNVYGYTNFYNSKRDYFLYLNYFNRKEKSLEKGNTTSKSVSVGFFYDHTLTKKSFLWSFYQGEKELKSSYNAHQFAGGLGLYLLNKDNAYITFNNGFMYKTIYEDNFINEFRYVLRLKSRVAYKKLGYIETYNYFQPLLKDVTDVNFITFNTLTVKIRKQFNFKVYHWLSKNNKANNLFQYCIVGFSIENW